MYGVISTLCSGGKCSARQKGGVSSVNKISVELSCAEMGGCQHCALSIKSAVQSRAVQHRGVSALYTQYCKGSAEQSSAAYGVSAGAADSSIGLENPSSVGPPTYKPLLMPQSSMGGEKFPHFVV